MPNSLLVTASVLAMVAGLRAPLFAQSPAPTAPISFSAYFQPQYERIDRRDDRARDRLFFRRMVLAAEANPFPHWDTVLQADLAPVISGDRLIVKDAYLRYSGLAHRGLTLTLGNQKTPFSRSVLQSSARRGIIERPFTGDKAFGAPGRALSARADLWLMSEQVSVGAAVASALHAPSAAEIRIDGLPEAYDDWNEGVLASGRVEWHPLGRMSHVHGTWNRREPARMMLAAAAYAWRNDGDRNLHTLVSGPTADADAVDAFEVGAALRAGRLSLDGELQRVAGATTAAGFNGGLYVNGSAVLRKGAVEGGWMVRRERVELLASADVTSADAYERPWRRCAVGVNWYLHGHDLKFQVMHRESWNVEGTADTRAHATHLQAQIGF